MTMAIRTSELATLLDSIPPGVRYLSLDCFDTLVWRNCATPADVFVPFHYGRHDDWSELDTESANVVPVA